MTKKVPRVLLVGAGRFGKNHLRVLRELQAKNRLVLTGVVVKTQKKKKELEREYGISAHTRLTPALLKSVDAVDIATPYPTHFSIVSQCLPYADVFVEKPIAENERDATALARRATRHGRVLMVGHIFRYHELTKEIREILRKKGSTLRKIEGSFVTPLNFWQGESAPLEKLHWFDLLDDFFNRKPDALWATGNKTLCRVHLRYGKVDVELELGWSKDAIKKTRSLTLHFADETVHKDFAAYTGPQPLQKELATFIGLISGTRAPYPNAQVGARIVGIARATEAQLKRPKKRIAIIGGGLFGATAAIMLSRIGKVTLFERHNDILQEASRANQYRHHIGYHYPRSPETIAEIQAATKEFEAFYKKAVLHDFPAYYAVVKEGSHMPAKEFLAVCKKMKLPYEKATLPGNILNPKEVALTIKTPEAELDYEYLKKEVQQRLTDSGVALQLGHAVNAITLQKNGEKEIRTKNKTYAFDYVINATYFNYNTFCDWLHFAPRDLELRLKEIIIAKLPLKKRLGVTIMDGPFATFLPLGRSGLYTFGDVPLSILSTASGKNAAAILQRKKKNVTTRWKEMQKRCVKWLPILKDAVYIDSMFVILPVEKQAKDTDARPTEVTPHGFGCYSILSGKLITAVHAAKDIEKSIRSV